MTELEPVAYAAFAENGNIRIWSQEPGRVDATAAVDSFKVEHLVRLSDAEARIRELERERDEWEGRSERMANDWLQFCADMDVTWDAQEAVAYELKADFSNLRARAEAAEALLKEAGKALEPFAQEADAWEGYSDIEAIVEDFPSYCGRNIRVSDLRAARSIASKIGGKG